MRHFLIVLPLLAPLAIQAQDDVRAFRPHTAVDTPSVAGSGTITVHQSDRIGTLMSDYSARKRPLKGYRVQIYLGDRNTAEDVRRSFLLKHPDVPAYLSYLAPNFRVRIGDQRDRTTAEKLREDLRSEFPGLYVVPDDIELPRLPEP